MTLLKNGKVLAGELCPLPAAVNAPVSLQSPTDAMAIISGLALRLRNLESAVKLMVPGDRVTSMIALTKDTVLIQAEKIAVAGEATFADYLRDQNGQATGVFDPSVTQIIGSKIRTGIVQNLNGTSYVNLDAVTTGQTFIQCASALSIMADGQFTFGSSTGKKLIWDGIDLTLGNSSLLGSTAVSTVVSNAASGATALAGLSDKLSKSAGDILSGAITVNSAGGISTGTIAWDSAGNVTSGSGGAFTAKGIVGASAGTVTFSVNYSTGAVVVKGDLSGSIGNFAGNLTSGGNVDVSGYVHASGAHPVSGQPNSVIYGYQSSSGDSVLGVQDGSGIAVSGYASATGYGVVGNSAAGIGGEFISTYGTALNVVGTSSLGGNTDVTGYDVKAATFHATGQITSTLSTGTAPFAVSSTTTVNNLMANYAVYLWDGYTHSFSGVPTTGAHTAGFSGANKPGSTSPADCVWEAEYHNGVKYWAPKWAD